MIINKAFSVVGQKPIRKTVWQGDNILKRNHFHLCWNFWPGLQFPAQERELLCLNIHLTIYGIHPLSLKPENIGWLYNQGTHRSLYVALIVFVCLFPLLIGTYSQSKIETKESIESQINRDGFVLVWRTASNRAGKETRTVYKEVHF